MIRETRDAEEKASIVRGRRSYDEVVREVVILT